MLYEYYLQVFATRPAMKNKRAMNVPDFTLGPFVSSDPRNPEVRLILELHPLWECNWIRQRPVSPVVAISDE